MEQILTDYPDIEVAQIQFNYLDYDDPVVQSRRCYEVCRKHIVMEPVVPSRFMRKFICRLRLNEVSRQ